MKRVWMVGAENGALRGGKVGGIGDVIRDLPPALAAAGHAVRVITPAYGVLHLLPQARLHGRIGLHFRGEPMGAKIYRIVHTAPDVEIFVIEHPEITRGQSGRIYFDDGPHRPFASDSGRFAFFSAAVAAWLEHCTEPPDILHLHDWHTGILPLLRHLAPPGARLASTRLVFTIHNIAYQGVRPLGGDPESPAAWFPGMPCPPDIVAPPGLPHCINFMATAIRLADQLNTVSPSYAHEILEPSNPARGFVGGEGLEYELRAASDAGRLHGILNGCSYSPGSQRRATWPQMLGALRASTDLLSASAGMGERLAALNPRRRPLLLVNVGRIAAQKVSLFLQSAGTFDSALEAILAELPGNGRFIMLGSGDRALEDRLQGIAAVQPKFIYLRGYSEELSDLIYRGGDLFVMPSTFEPCGISQMLAMRGGQPCVVHAVGGLTDTVRDGVNGFSFGGATPQEQAQALVRKVAAAVDLRRRDKQRWREIKAAAAAARFTWELSAAAYIRDVYHTG